MPVRKQVFDSREEWLQARRERIGGSDASACVGMSPYKDNVQIWEEKLGLIEVEDISWKEHVRYGIYAESHLRDLFSLDFPEYRVSYEENNMFLNSDYPWMHASLDGELVDGHGRRGILEIKTSMIQQSTQKEKWRNRVPDYYYCQILHYLAVTEYDFAVLKAYLRHVTGGEVSASVRHYLFERKKVEEDIRYLVEAEKKLWDCIQSGRRPDLILPAI